MTENLDRFDRVLRPGDLVRAGAIAEELFRIKSFQFPAEAIIENVIPGGRLGTSTLPCADLAKEIGNPGPPDWMADTGEQPALDEPVPGTRLPCGCYMRLVDTEVVLCEKHLIDAATGAGPA